MELIVRVAEGDIAQKSYDLFHIVMQAPAPLAYSEEKKWDVSRLTMHGAYKRNESLPPVGDPQDMTSLHSWVIILTWVVRTGMSQSGMHYVPWRTLLILP